ncbi:MAG: glycosyltransferase family 39 protein [Candidatus Omnitrophica bacterium]|nr:glycosyltransferase family 39 protein [Candidatus Omnitrophota bacterium]MDE2230791.1 glycosyltransferase family 39 protein [Candidatus Omnitrophota bacterium]
MGTHRRFLILLAVMAAGLLWVLSPKFFPFTFDSMVYISTAQHIRLGHGLICSNFYIEKSTKDFIPLDMEPPGYPVLASLFMFLGMSGFTAGLLVPRLCFLLLPFLFYSIFKRLTAPSRAMVGAFVCTFMFAAVRCALMAWSDIPCLCFSLMALLLAFRVIEQGGKAPVLLVLSAGAAAGYTYLIRFVGVTLIFSIAAGFAAWVILKLVSKKDFFKTIFIYLAGTAMVTGPYFYRNWHVWGRIQSYAAPPSHVGWAKNIMDYLGGIAVMFWGDASMKGLALLVILVAGAVMLAHSRKALQGNRRVFVFTVILAVYFLTNSVVLVAFRSIWYSVEKIDSRYLVQIVWILMFAAVAAAGRGIDFLKNRQGLNKARTAGFLLFAFCVIQVVSAQGALKYEKNQLAYSKIIEHYVPLLQKVPKDFVIVTNFPELVYYHVPRNVRALNIYTPGDLAYFKRKFAVFLIKDGWNSAKKWGWYKPAWIFPAGYHILFADGHVDLLCLHQRKI